MKITFSNLVLDARNKIGGTIFQKNHWGILARNFVKGVVRQNEFTQPNRSSFSRFSYLWETLTEAQRLAWTNAAPDYSRVDSMGNLYYLTGSTLFQSLNLNLTLINQPIILAPPVANVPPVVFAASIVWNSGTQHLSIVFPVGYIDPTLTYIINCSRELSPGIFYKPSEFRFIILINPSAAASYDITSEYFSRFSDAFLNKKVLMRSYAVDKTSGIASAIFEDSVILD